MQNHPLKPITVTVANARAVSGLGNTKFYELINEGKIKTITIGRRRLIIYPHQSMRYSLLKIWLFPSSCLSPLVTNDIFSRFSPFCSKIL